MQGNNHDFIGKQRDAATAAGVEELLSPVSDCSIARRLPILEMAMPSLRQLSENERADFLNLVQHFVQVDKRITLFEFVAVEILRLNLVKDPRRSTAQYFSFNDVVDEIRYILSVLVQIGGTTKIAAAETFSLIMSRFSEDSAKRIWETNFSYRDLKQALA